MKHLVTHILWIVLSVCLLTGCNGQGDIVEDFQNEDPKVRISAIRRAGSEKLESSVPYLVDRLSDSEADVRMFAIVALEKITGETHGYRHYDDSASRNEAIDRWRRWLVDNKLEPVTPKPVEKRKTG
jgi:HEAT repeat protein